MVRCLFVIACLSIIAVMGKTVEGSSIEYAPFRYTVKEGLDPHPAENVVQRGLVVEDVSQESILDEYARYSSETNVKNTGSMPILGFVTPWNLHGFEVAKIFRSKFTHISPCWFLVRRNEANALTISGKDDIKMDWISEMRNDCGENCPKIVPRVNWQASAIHDEDIPLLAKLFADLIETYNFDGLVFEFSFSNEAIPTFTAIREAIGSKTLITVVHPEHCTIQLKYVRDEDHVVEQMNKLVDFTILMTYDYSNKKYKLGSNAPMNYYKKSVQQYLSGVQTAEKKPSLKQLMLGLPMYGYRDFDVLIGQGFINHLKRFTVSIEFHKNSEDHFITYKDEKNKNHFITYPTLKFIQARIDLAKKLNTGLSLWDIGQGLDYFYDLF